MGDDSADALISEYSYTSMCGKESAMGQTVQQSAHNVVL